MRNHAGIGRAMLELLSSLKEIRTVTPRLTEAQCRRRKAIRDCVEAGAPLSLVAKAAGVSTQRIHNIVKQERERDT